MIILCGMSLSEISAGIQSLKFIDIMFEIPVTLHITSKSEA